MTTKQLRIKAHKIARQLGIEENVWEKFMGILKQLEEHDEASYQHCLRVGIYTYWLAKNSRKTNKNLRLPFFAGCAHDLGKCSISTDVLNAVEFGPEQFEKIKHHPWASYDILKDSFLITAMAAGIHHQFQPNAYGINLEEVAPDWVGDELLAHIYEAVHMLVLADFFDALTTRDNTRFDLNDDEAINAVMLGHFPDRKREINLLITNRIL